MYVCSTTVWILLITTIKRGPRWAPCWPHEPCYQGTHVGKPSDVIYETNVISLGNKVRISYKIPLNMPVEVDPCFLNMAKCNANNDVRKRSFIISFEINKSYHSVSKNLFFFLHWSYLCRIVSQRYSRVIFKFLLNNETQKAIHFGSVWWTVYKISR